ncbi:hypothetical protein TNCT_329231 [Trichonephila clavata]|uniref:Uncharacterized protein n=1 Tax=Trichonephila clavata TaxID=2740835 RepID=A0A8X6F5I2_TRICU|nr:hypothetical protein TNCT_329231 [Trichonephila clavata]
MSLNYFDLGKKMKIFALLLLVGVASASFHEMLDDASEEFVHSFLEGMENAPSLREHFQEFDEQFVDEIEIKVKKEIGSRLREVLNKILERVKEGIEQGKVAKEEIFDKVCPSIHSAPKSNFFCEKKTYLQNIVLI